MKKLLLIIPFLFLTIPCYAVDVKDKTALQKYTDIVSNDVNIAKDDISIIKDQLKETALDIKYIKWESKIYLAIFSALGVFIGLFIGAAAEKRKHPND